MQYRYEAEISTKLIDLGVSPHQIADWSRIFSTHCTVVSRILSIAVGS